jgi:benzoate-CoA ligase family protein
MSLHTLFDAIFAAGRDSHTAVVYEHDDITYGGLREQTIRAAEVLHPLDLQIGERVAILLNDSPEFIAAFIAVQSLGGIAVPINMGLSVEEQRLILSDCAARLAIVEGEICNKLLKGAREKLRHLKEILLVRRDLDPSVTQVDGFSFSVLAEAPRQTVGAEFPARPTDETPAFILYTSGSTGDPKGAVHTQAHVFYTNETYCKQVLRLRPGDRLFSSSRLPFAYGLGNSFSFPLLNGVTTILCREKPTPEVISRTFREYRPTIFFGVPVVFNLLLELNRRDPLDCSSLRLCISAGEALPAHIGEEWQKTFGVEVLDGIGSTEMLHMWMSNHEGEVRYGSSGRLLEGYEARLLDQDGNPAQQGETGHLWVKGASAALGYWQRPEVTARTFIDGWVRTGDLYREDADGYWFHMGRSDDCFKSSGQWVSPVEVEGVLIQHQAVSRVAVVEDFDENGLPCPCAFVVKADHNLGLDELENELTELARGALPRYKRPRKYIFVSELPYTATGKIQRFKLREQLRNSRKCQSS